MKRNNLNDYNLHIYILYKFSIYVVLLDELAGDLRKGFIIFRKHSKQTMDRVKRRLLQFTETSYCMCATLFSSIKTNKMWELFIYLCQCLICF